MSAGIIGPSAKLRQAAILSQNLSPNPPVATIS
jgi:hypothetical protein